MRRLATAMTAAALVLLPVVPAHADAVRDADWALDALHAQDAWQRTKGKGVTVAVLDTGVDGTHPDLSGQVLEGKDMVGFGARRGDAAWARHGTGMAGIIAGHGHGPGGSDGVLGIAPQARILPVRVILEDKDPQRKKARTTRGSALADGIRWAADHGADVINLSLGDDSRTAHPEAQEDDAIQYALRKGVVVVASAGNGGEQGNRASYPAAYPGVIAVAAVDRYGSRAAFSTRRWYATVAAPGVDVVIADPNRRYYEGWGTSTASAYVSGTAALVRSAYPRLSPAQVKRLLEDTARSSPAGGRDDAVGHGLVDPAAALKAAAKVKPEAVVPSAVPYTRKYFGAGPDAAKAAAAADGDALGDGIAVVFAVAGTGLVAAAALLWLRPRLTNSRNGRRRG
ncbi:type VII secretion-associated serine protease mycosin [Actinacidiphila glaucinigra]|uniref:Type VII secretion-associated serine protease mycosin n=1 Tax=Actinacidiphila glaucinigra TaxID=235986 RepID=A0A239NMB2_9ACTN|nr:type VII secretion-associated serine protease mycosin [Actinacidiphila glaucinigra]SNT55508.1 type VII secretion-associated serine protease mycosin [Actinacidiphila glaucinigra]